jgi:hypothetical protein
MRKDWKTFKPIKPEPSSEKDDAVCVDCGRRVAYTVEGKRIYTAEWFTCAYCGKPVCEGCRKEHIPLCMALTWNLGKLDEDGEFKISEDKPHQFTIG